jgi:hypothetical protein
MHEEAALAPYEVRSVEVHPAQQVCSDRHALGEKMAQVNTRGPPVIGLAVSRIWAGWRLALAIVKPETVVAWHRAGFRLSGPGRCGAVAVMFESDPLRNQKKLNESAHTSLLA